MGHHKSYHAAQLLQNLRNEHSVKVFFYKFRPKKTDVEWFLLAKKLKKTSGTHLFLVSSKKLEWTKKCFWPKMVESQLVGKCRKETFFWAKKSCWVDLEVGPLSPTVSSRVIHFWKKCSLGRLELLNSRCVCCPCLRLPTLMILVQISLELKHLPQSN